MGILTDFYVASRDAAQAVLDGETKGLPTLLLKGVDTVKLESLEKILAKSLAAKGPLGRTNMLTDPEAEQWVLVVSPPLVDLLTRADKVASEAAEAWAKTAELKADGWSASEAKKAVHGLSALAVKAKKAKLDLLLRMSL